MGNGEINQIKCWIATGGHLWMRGYFDTLPLPVRRRLRSSPFNLCPACLVTECLPKLYRKHPKNTPYEKLSLAAIEDMEREVRKGKGSRWFKASPNKRHSSSKQATLGTNASSASARR